MGWVFSSPDNSAGSIASQKWLGAVSRNSCSNSLAAIAAELPFSKKSYLWLKYWDKWPLKIRGAPIAPFAPHAIAHANRKLHS